MVFDVGVDLIMNTKETFGLKRLECMMGICWIDLGLIVNKIGGGGGGEPICSFRKKENMHFDND